MPSSDGVLRWAARHPRAHEQHERGSGATPGVAKPVQRDEEDRGHPVEGRHEGAGPRGKEPHPQRADEHRQVMHLADRRQERNGREIGRKQDELRARVAGSRASERGEGSQDQRREQRPDEQTA